MIFFPFRRSRLSRVAIALSSLPRPSSPCSQLPLAVELSACSDGEGGDLMPGSIPFAADGRSSRRK